jgi:hypothetical protein
MSPKKSARFATALAIAAIGALMTGCGSSNNSPGIPGNNPLYGPNGTPIAGCVPVSSQIPFTANNMYFDWANIVAGAIPGSQSIGQVLVGGAATGGPYQRSGVDGTISMNIIPVGQTTTTPYPGYPSGTFPSPYTMPTTGLQSQMANASGFLQISPATQQDIMNQVAMNPSAYGVSYPYGTGYPNTGYPYTNYPYTQPGMIPQPGYPQQTQVCVSAIAMNVGHYYNTIYGGNVYIYLNGTQHGYVLYF